MTLRLCSALLFCLGACAPLPATSPGHSGWMHDGPVGPLQLERDRADCHMYLDAAQDDGAMNPPHRTVHEWDDAFIACMAERGWRPQ